MNAATASVTARARTAPLRSVLAWTGALLTAPAMHACTVCNSAGGHQVRAGIFDGHFLHTLWLVALPFPVFAAAVGLVRFAVPVLLASPRRPGAPR